ncbi:MAG: branched-chain amino acid ABC transporter permease [Geminicoccaceae bacterium]
MAAAARGKPMVPWVSGILVLLAALGLQSQLYSGQERTVTTIFMFVALAQAWNLIGGYAGYASFGQVVFFGVGGYFTAVAMTHWHLSFWTCLVLAGAVAALFGALIGMPLLRLRGHYFAIATLGVAEGMREVVTNLPELTGGGAGITLPTVGAQATTAYLGNDGFYLLFLALAALAMLVSALVAGSKPGLEMGCL